MQKSIVVQMSAECCLKLPNRTELLRSAKIWLTIAQHYDICRSHLISVWNSAVVQCC